MMFSSQIGQIYQNATIYQNQEVEKELRKRIRRLFNDNQSRETVFIQMSRETGLHVFSSNIVTNLFKLFDEAAEITEDGIEANHRYLLRMITDEKEKRKREISVWSNTNSSFKIIDSRYAMMLTWNSTERTFHFFDNWCNEKRQIKVTGKFQAISPSTICKLHFIDFSSFIILENWINSNYTYAHFVRLDLQESTCKQFAARRLHGIHSNVISDIHNNRRFAICTGVGNINTGTVTFHLWISKLEKAKLMINKVPYLIDFPIDNARLSGNRIECFYSYFIDRQSVHKQKMLYGEFSLIAGQQQPKFNPLFEMTNLDSDWEYSEMSYYWCGNMMYALGKSVFGEHRNGLVVYDLENRTVKKRKFFEHTNRVSSNFYVDIDGIMTLSTPTFNSDCAVYRFAVTSTESLIDIAYFTLYRTGTLKKYPRFKSVLPEYLKPFAISPALNKQEPSTSEQPGTSK